MMRVHNLKGRIAGAFGVAAVSFFAGVTPVHAITVAQGPLVQNAQNSPMAMIVMGNDHTLFYQAYNDASDLNGDGLLNVGYDPERVDYFGYFNIRLCYDYNDARRRFEPSSATANKKCSGSWSGDFLNYVTTSRIDALRKVLYGGTRLVDTEDETVLARAFIPQDAHSWGKEYRSEEHDGYDIREYTPLDLPATGTRHLIANTTLLERGDNPTGREPRMRVLTDSRFRIWNWTAKERPVAGQGNNSCDRGNNSTTNCEYAATTVSNDSHPANATDFQNLFDEYGIPELQCGFGPIAGGNINSIASSNPFTTQAGCTQDNYFTRIRGQIRAPATGTWRFATNGDDAVEFRVNGNIVSFWYGGHGFENAGGTPLQQATGIAARANAQVGSIELLEGEWYDFEFRHEERGGGDGYRLLWQDPVSGDWSVVPSNAMRGLTGDTSVPEIATWKRKREIPASVMTDYIVHVVVCDEDFPEQNCRSYGDPDKPILKPTGLLHSYGEDGMTFGLITGSSTHPYNMRGGVLRKNVEAFSNEVNPDTGQFRDVPGIVQTIDRMRVVDFNVGQNFQYNGGWLTTASMANSTSQFPDWGNPIGEMLYETLRYFSGKAEPTANFFNRDNLHKENGELFERVRLRDIPGTVHNLLPAPEWKDPYTRPDSPKPWCTPAAQLIISDVNPSFDTEFIPGSEFSSFAGDIPGLDAGALASQIWTAEYGGARNVFIGESGSVSDSAPSEKSVSSFADIRGLAPSEPTRQGGYYSASIARYGYLNDLRDDLRGTQNIQTFSVALASPLPRLDLPTRNGIVSLVPFAKSTGGSSISNVKGNFQPTNTIVDFFVEEFANTDPDGSDKVPEINEGRPYVVFRINYEDVEQGADHDMDAIVRYEVRVNADDTLSVSLRTEYQAGGIQHAMGYVISGTTADGVYLEVGDTASTPRYFLNTPPGRAPGWCDQGTVPAECGNLPLQTTRNFTPSTASDGAMLLNSPLWYAAKYGADGNEGLATGETPENYFLVTNASTLEEQLRAALARILQLSPTTSVAVSTTRLTIDDLAFSTEYQSEGWSGEVKAIRPDFDAEEETVIWRASNRLPAPGERQVFTWDRGDNSAKPFKNGAGLTNTTMNAIGTLELNNGTLLVPPSIIIDYIRGDQSAEAANGLRVRTSRMSDIVNSVPVYSGRGNEGWVRIDGDGNPSYAEHIERRQNMTPILLVGSNGGMLHALKATVDGGQELFSYVPSAVLPNLKQLANPDYTHRYFVDGQIAVADAILDNQWKRVAVATTGAGGRTVFALNVTDPDSFGVKDVLWEFTDPDLGYTIGTPIITRLDDGTRAGKWVAIFGNGFASPNHRAYLFVVDLETGELIDGGKVPLGLDGSAADPNGLASPGLWMDPNGKTAAARVYAGDLHGNVWRVDFVQSASDRSPGPLPIRPFNAAGNSNDPLFSDPDRRRITGGLAVAAHPLNGLMVFFGTGSFFAEGDNIVPVDAPIESFYGIRDNRVTSSGVPQPVPMNVDLGIMRLGNGTSSYIDVVDEGDEGVSGWKLNLATDGQQLGERVLNKPAVIAGRVFFNSYVPSEDPCEGGGNSYLYILNAISPISGDYTVPPEGEPPGGIGSPRRLLGPGAPLVTPIVIGEPEPLPPTVPPYSLPPQASWCRTVSVLVPDVDGRLQPQVVSTLCDGRQSWRQQL